MTFPSFGNGSGYSVTSNVDSGDARTKGTSTLERARGTDTAGAEEWAHGQDGISP